MFTARTKTQIYMMQDFIVIKYIKHLLNDTCHKHIILRPDGAVTVFHPTEW